MLCNLKRRSYHTHLGDCGDGIWNLHSRVAENWEGVTVEGKVQRQGKDVPHLGTIRDSIWLPWGHVNRKGDTFSWKERPASCCGGLKVKVSFWKQWGKLSILEKREAAGYWQTENWGNWVWILPLSCGNFVALGKFLKDYKELISSSLQW